MISEEHIKEGLSQAFAIAVAHKAGLNISTEWHDYGIDGTFKDVKRRGRRRVNSGFNIEFQLKSTINASCKDGKISYDLEVKNYNDLVDETVRIPRILILFLLPQDSKEWIKVEDNKTIIQKCGWWYSLKGMKPSKNKKRKRIHIPIEQILTPNELRELMDKFKRDGEL